MEVRQRRKQHDLNQLVAREPCQENKLEIKVCTCEVQLVTLMMKLYVCR